MKKIITSIIFLFMLTVSINMVKATVIPVGTSITGQYTYYDPEGDLEGQSLFQWYRDGVAIDGATYRSYTITSQDVGHTLIFEVTPVSLTGISPGEPIRSEGIAITAQSAGNSGGGGSSGGGMISVIIPASTSTPVITFLTSGATTSTTTVVINNNSNLGSIISQIARTLKYGMSGVDVKALQIYLNTNGYIVAKSGAGSSGHETNYFGLATKAAVMRFQKANKITPVSGLVGPLTRAVINR